MHLLLLPNLGAFLNTNGTVVLTQKLLDGIEEYTNHWPGQITVLLRPLDEVELHPDIIEVDIEKLKFKLVVIEYQEAWVREYIEWADAVLAGTAFETNFLARQCQKQDTALIYITELSLTTRIQIINSGAASKFKRFKQIIWATRQEFRQMLAIRRSDGVQCNGFPTFNQYKFISPNPLIFFDSRLKVSQMIDDQELLGRVGRLKIKLEKNESINLMFSGRFERIKGVDTLIDLAEDLSKRNYNFKLYLAGSGSLQKEMESQVKHRNLSHRVKFLGVLGFERELLHWVKRNADVFICCHRQGDPSCTYLETLGCGTPIVGIKNEALSDILSLRDCGISLPRKNLSRLVDAIESLGYAEIKKMSFNARNFALNHGFNETFKERVEHVCQCIDAHKSKNESNSSIITFLKVFISNFKLVLRS